MTKQEKYFKNEIQKKVKPLPKPQPLHEPWSEKLTELMKDFAFRERNVIFKIQGRKNNQPGFIWDNASKLIRRPVHIKPSLAHDYLYRFGLTDRKTADLIYYDLLLKNGVSKFRAKAQYAALRMFGAIVFNKYKRKGYHLNP